MTAPVDGTTARFWPASRFRLLNAWRTVFGPRRSANRYSPCRCNRATSWGPWPMFAERARKVDIDISGCAVHQLLQISTDPHPQCSQPIGRQKVMARLSNQPAHAVPTRRFNIGVSGLQNRLATVLIKLGVRGKQPSIYIAQRCCPIEFDRSRANDEPILCRQRFLASSSDESAGRIDFPCRKYPRRNPHPCF